jgi:quinoprotein glucose dehydrogenase
MPGEWYSPTQPFPTKPPAYDRQGVSIDDLIDFTPELRAEAVKLVSRYKLGPMFDPPVVSKLEGPLAMRTHILYVFSQTNVSALGLVPPPSPEISTMAYISGTALTGGSGSANATPAGGEGGGGGLTVQGLPLVKPPYGRITAIDLNQGEILWQVAHGETPDPALKDATFPRTGRPGIIGTLVTKTLVIAGEAGTVTTANGQRGAMLRAYDKATGSEVGAVYMAAPKSGSPMTYMLNGKQYVVLAISGGTYSGELVAYGLPSQQ